VPELPVLVGDVATSTPYLMILDDSTLWRLTRNLSRYSPSKSTLRRS